MNYLIASDLHGSLPAARRLVERFAAERFDLLLLLGDTLNYGPRNGVPDGLDAPGVAAALAPLAAHTIAVRGNCDSEVDQMLLPFPTMADYALVCTPTGKRLFLTHGHRYTVAELPPLSCDVFLAGHTHLWQLAPGDGERPALCNVGSPTFPKGGNPPTYATLRGDRLAVHHFLTGETLSEIDLARSE